MKGRHKIPARGFTRPSHSQRGVKSYSEAIQSVGKAKAAISDRDKIKIIAEELNASIGQGVSRQQRRALARSMQKAMR